MMKVGRRIPLFVMMMTLLLLLSGSVVTGVQAAKGDDIGSLVVTSLNDEAAGGNKTLNIKSKVAVKALYYLASSLPKFPEDRACILLAGPIYNMTFFYERGIGQHRFVLNRGGCGTLTIDGHDVRLLNSAYIKLFNQAILNTIASQQPDNLNVKIFDVSKPQPRGATIKMEGQIAGLYKSLLKSPVQAQHQACPKIAGPKYTLTFYDEGQKLVQAQLDRGGCGTAVINNYMSIGGETRLVSKTFWQLLDKALKGTKVTKVYPTKLDGFKQELSNDPSSATKTFSVTNSLLIGKLYDTIYAMPPLDIARSCIAQVGPRYDLTFSDSDGVLLAVSADKSGCGSVSFSEFDVRQPEQNFWKILSIAESA